MIQETPEAIIKRTIGRHLNLDQSFVFLFGSRATGTASPASDYDIGLYSGKEIPLAVLAKINGELEDYPIPVDIDLVDFSSVSKEFKEIALRKVTIWNTPKNGLRLI